MQSLVFSENRKISDSGHFLIPYVYPSICHISVGMYVCFHAITVLFLGFCQNFMCALISRGDSMRLLMAVANPGLLNGRVQNFCGNLH